MWTKAEDWRREIEKNMSSSKDWGDLLSISKPEEGTEGPIMGEKMRNI